MSDPSPIGGGPSVARQPLGESHAEKLELLRRSLRDPGALQRRSVVADLKATLTQIPTGQRQAVLALILDGAPTESRAALRALLEAAGETELARGVAALQAKSSPTPDCTIEVAADSHAGRRCAASADSRAVLRALDVPAETAAGAAKAGATTGAARRPAGIEGDVSPTDAARTAHAARTQAAATARLAKKGIRIDSALAGVAGSATVTEAMSLRDLAAAVFNVPAERVGPMHYQLLLRANPELASRSEDRASIRLRAGETVSLRSSPVVLDLQRDQLRAGIANIESAIRFAGDPPLSHDECSRLREIEASMRQQLREVEVSAQATRGLLDVAEVSTATAPLAQAGDIDGLVARFAAVDARIAQQARALPAGSAERRKLEVVRTQLRMSRAAALEKGAQALLSQKLDGPAARRAIEMVRRDYHAVVEMVEPRHRVTFELRQVALTRLEMSSYTYEPVLQKVQQAHGEPVKVADLEPAERRAFDGALRGIDETQRRLRSQLEGIQSDDPAVKALVGQQLARLPHVIRSTRADLYTSVGDRANAVRELHEDFRAHSGIGAPAFATDESRYISANNEELSWLGSVFRSDTTVGFLSRRKRDAIVSRIQGLSPELRDQALQVLYRIGGTYADMGDIDGTNAVRQVLLELGERTGDNAIVTQAMFIASNYRQQIGDMKGSTEVLQKAMETAARMPDDNPLKGQLRARAAMAYAGSLAATAAAGESKGEREQAARSLSAFRQKLEQAREPLGKNQLGQLVLMEANAFVTSNQSRFAERAMAALAPYRDNPAIEKAYHSFFEGNAKGNVEAAIKVALRELNNESLAEALGYGLGGAAVGAATGAAIGVWFFGVGALVGAGVGAIVGGAAGTATIKGINLYRGWDNIEQAADTGLTHLTLGDAVMDSMFLALDVAAVVLPVKGAGQIGKAGVVGLVRGAGTEVAEANLRAGNKLVRGYIRDMSETLVRREGTELSSEAVTQLARRLGLRDGGTFVRNVADQVSELVRRGIDPTDYLERAAKTAILKRFAESSLDFSGKWARRTFTAGGMGALTYALAPLMSEGVSAYGSGDAARWAAWKRNFGKVLVTLLVMGSSAMAANHFAANPRVGSRELRKLIREAEADAARLTGRIEQALEGVDVEAAGGTAGLAALMKLAEDAEANRIDEAAARVGVDDGGAHVARSESEARKAWLDTIRDPQDQAAARMLLGKLDGAPTAFEPQHFQTLIRLVRNGISTETALGLSDAAAVKLLHGMPDFLSSPIHMDLKRSRWSFLPGMQDRRFVEFSDGTRSRVSQEVLTSPAQRKWEAFAELVGDPAVLDRVRQELRPVLRASDWQEILTEIKDTPQGRQFLEAHKRSRFAKGALMMLQKELGDELPAGKTIDDVIEAYEARWAASRERFNAGRSLARRAGVTLDGEAPGLSGPRPRSLEELYARIQQSTVSVFSQINDPTSSRSASTDALSHRAGAAHQNIHVGRGARGVQGQARDLLHEGLHTLRRYEPKLATTVKGWADNLFEEVLAPMHETAAFDMAELRRTLDDPEALEKWVAAKQARYSSPDLGGAELFGPPGQARAVVEDVVARLQKIMADGPSADRVDNVVAYLLARVDEVSGPQPSAPRPRSVGRGAASDGTSGAGLKASEVAAKIDDFGRLYDSWEELADDITAADDIKYSYPGLTADDVITGDALTWMVERFRKGELPENVDNEAHFVEGLGAAYRKHNRPLTIDDIREHFGMGGPSIDTADIVHKVSTANLDALEAAIASRRWAPQAGPGLHAVAGAIDDANLGLHSSANKMLADRVVAVLGETTSARGTAYIREIGELAARFKLLHENLKSVSDETLAAAFGRQIVDGIGTGRRSLDDLTALLANPELKGLLSGLSDEYVTRVIASDLAADELVPLLRFVKSVDGQQARPAIIRALDAGDAGLRRLAAERLGLAEPVDLPSTRLFALAADDLTMDAIRSGRVPDALTFMRDSKMEPAAAAREIAFADHLIAKLGQDPARVRAEMGGTPGLGALLGRHLASAPTRNAAKPAFEVRAIIDGLGPLFPDGLPKSVSINGILTVWKRAVAADQLEQMAGALRLRLNETQQATLRRALGQGAASDGTSGMGSARDKSLSAGPLRDWVAGGTRNGRTFPLAAREAMDSVADALSQSGVDRAQKQALETHVLDLLDGMHAANQTETLARVQEAAARFDALARARLPGRVSQEIISAILEGSRSASDLAKLTGDPDFVRLLGSLGQGHPDLVLAVWKGGADVDELTPQLRFIDSVRARSGARETDRTLLAEMDAAAAEQRAGRLTRLGDWVGFVAEKSQDDLGRAAGELREARRLAAEHPASVIDVAGDAKAPLRPGTKEPLPAFDLAVEDAAGNVVRSVEVTTVVSPVRKAYDLTQAVRHAADKAAARVKEGDPIRGALEVSIRMQLDVGTRSLGSLVCERLADGTVNTRRRDTGAIIHTNNVLDLFAVQLSRILNNQRLDRVSLVHPTTGSVVAAYRRNGAVWTRVP